MPDWPPLRQLNLASFRVPFIPGLESPGFSGLDIKFFCFHKYRSALLRNKATRSYVVIDLQRPSNGERNSGSAEISPDPAEVFFIKLDLISRFRHWT
jgi:hypothetical protein